MKIKPLIFGTAFFASLAPIRAAAKTIVFLGDSLTAGYGLAEENAYPALIQSRMEQDGLDWTVVNAGVSGDTTRGGLKRLDWILQSKPSLVFIALGANDGLRGIKTEYTRENLEAIILRLKKEKISVVLAGMRMPTNYGEAYTKSFRAMFASVAKKQQVPFLPFLLEGVVMSPDLNQADGIHPNEKGHQVMAKNIYQFLKPFLTGGTGGKIQAGSSGQGPSLKGSSSNASSPNRKLN